MSFDNPRQFLVSISASFEIPVLAERQLLSHMGDALTRCRSWHKRDCPLKPPLVFWLLIAMSLYRNLSIPNAFKRLLHEWRPKTIGPGRLVTPEALWRARQRLGFEPVKVLFEAIAKGELPYQTFRGLRTWGFDGTYFTTPDTPSNVAAFGKKNGDRGDAAYPQVLGVFLVDLWSHRLRDCQFLASNGSERQAVVDMLGRLGHGDLVMMDRGISAYRILHECESRRVSYLARINRSWTPVIVDRLGDGDFLVDLRPNKPEMIRLRSKGLDCRALRARMIIFTVANGDKVRLVTNLLNRDEFPARELAAEYHKRWECEIAYKELKGYLTSVTHGKQDTTFRSKLSDGVLQEAWSIALTYNLIRGLMMEAASEHCEPAASPTQLSFVDTLETLKLSLCEPDQGRPKRVLLFELLGRVSKCYIDRPRRHRAYPRKVKRKMSRFGLKRSGDRQILCDFAKEIRLCG